MRLYDKLYPKAAAEALAVPRVITLYRNCVRHRVQDSLIFRLHFNDLYLLLMSLDIADAKAALDQKQRTNLQRRGIAELKEVPPAGAAKFLRGISHG